MRKVSEPRGACSGLIRIEGGIETGAGENIVSKEKLHIKTEEPSVRDLGFFGFICMILLSYAYLFLINLFF